MGNALYSEILDILENDAKASVEDMALMTGASPEEIRQAVERLEQDKTIVKYTAIVNRQKVKSDEAEALIEVKVVPKRGQGYDDLAERIYGFSEVKSVYLMSGAYDLSVWCAHEHETDIAVWFEAGVLEGVASTVNILS